MTDAEYRWDPFYQRWIIVAPQRSNRPGGIIAEQARHGTHNPDTCPFCAGNDHLAPEATALCEDPEGQFDWKFKVIPNKYPVITTNDVEVQNAIYPYTAWPALGKHEVVIETPTGEKQLWDLPPQDIAQLLKLYQDRMLAHQEDENVWHVLPFKNHGLEGGATLPHSHSQIISTSLIHPTFLATARACRAHWGSKGESLFERCIEAEKTADTRLLLQNQYAIAYLPYAGLMPFETWVLPKQKHPRFEEASAFEMQGTAELLYKILHALYKTLGDAAYNFTIHSAPKKGWADSPLLDFINENVDENVIDRTFFWHIRIAPRITGIAGFELGSGTHINPFAPEKAAKTLAEAL